MGTVYGAGKNIACIITIIDYLFVKSNESQNLLTVFEEDPMARIPEDEIERMKQEVSVQRLAEARGIKLERHGADLIGLCPFHEDREPSLVITPSKNLWHCLGACRAGGSVIDWVMRANGVSFRHAVELLRANHPSLAAPGPVVRKATTAAVKLETPFERDADDQRVLQPGGRLLPRDAEAKPGGAEVSAGPRAWSIRT